MNGNLVLNMPDESSQKMEGKAEVSYEDETNVGRFGREFRLSKNNCPLCSFVQKEMDKGNPLPIEEWIYISHLNNAHGFEP